MEELLKEIKNKLENETFTDTIKGMLITLKEELEIEISST